MAIKLKDWDAAEHLQTDEDIRAYLDVCLADGDPEFIAVALGNIARASGMTQVAKAAGLSRESLYRALSAKGNPAFSTILKSSRSSKRLD